MRSNINNLSKNELIKKVHDLQNKLNGLENEKFFIYNYIGKYFWDFNNNIFKIINDTLESPLSNLINSDKSKIHTEDALRVYNELKEQLISEYPFFTIEFRIKLNDGSYQWVRTFGRVIDYDDENEIFTFNFVYKPTDKETDNFYKLEVEKAKFKQLFDHFNAGVVLIDNENSIIDINDKFSEIFGYSIKEAQGKNIDDLIVPEDLKDQGEKYSNQVLKGDSIATETIRESKSGIKKDFFVNAFPIKLDKDQIGLYSIYYDISDRKKYERSIKYLSFHDELTGLYNRRYFLNELKRLNNSEEFPISIIIGDIDNLKKINDTYGHKVGDEYIKDISEILTESVRDEDIVSRLGGDEFAIILIGADKNIAEKVINRIKEKCDNHNSSNGYNDSLKISLGFSIKDDKFKDLEKIVNKADKMMYENKNNLRN